MCVKKREETKMLAKVVSCCFLQFILQKGHLKKRTAQMILSVIETKKS